MNADSAILLVRRSSDWRRDTFRTYHIWVDGVRVAAVKRAKSIGVPVSVGRHSVQVRIAWCSSPEVTVDVEPGDEIHLECGPNRTGSPLSQVLGETSNYLFIRVLGAQKP